MKIKNLFITNKSGGLIYSANRDQPSNYLMILSSSLHTIYVHIQEIETLKNKLRNEPLIIQLKSQKIVVFKTLTGFCFIFLVCDDEKVNDDEYNIVFKNCYKIFSDFALKNPFYIDEMPINSEKFEHETRIFLNKYS